MKTDMISKYFIYFIIIIFILGSRGYTQGKKTAGSNGSKSHWTLLGGYGATHPGLGHTPPTMVKTADLIFRYGHYLSKEKGRSWYSGRREILYEVPVSFVISPGEAIITGFNFLNCWNFTSSKTIIPYVFAGGGFIYTDLNLPDEDGDGTNQLGTKYNGNYQAGLGINYMLIKDLGLNFEYRYHHISNGSTAKPNAPLNSSKILLGLSFFKF